MEGSITATDSIKENPGVSMKENQGIQDQLIDGAVQSSDQLIDGVVQSDQLISDVQQQVMKPVSFLNVYIQKKTFYDL